MMSQLGIDLRGISEREAPGAGIAHVTRELWNELLSRQNEEFRFIPLYRRKDFYKGPEHVLFPSGAVPPWFRGNAFPLVHDLFIFERPEWFPQGGLKRFFTTHAFLYGLRRAKRIFTVSEFTKRQVMRHSGIPWEKISPVYQGVEIGYSMDRTRSSDSYVLALGTIEPRKNLQLLFDLVLNGGLPKEMRLIVAGREGWGKVHIPNHPQIRYLGEVSAETKSELLRNARALLLPSLAEGFGRTALEAMTVGTPVIAAHRGALPEVVGDAGMLLDPYDNAAWRDALRRMTEDESVRNAFIRKGYTQAKRFTWERTVDKMLANLSNQ